ncbi:type IV toxin-antitoxin system AbiEi family antitoxin domain-containing protein [Lolliginicoccus levis]|uniref:type IV toxin-antitoxin system AbiEi family antitoxin domain-containing protein n=1 Tax=Lolliginicoccus levis TaxID=2919542 RepID=UPI00241C6633|nr:type IV toxin-antitoxin system AbiEi family antitoxin domain-containing protein [Lolliginicoccus levis]
MPAIPEDIRYLLHRRGGVIHTTEARESGISRQRLGRLVGSGTLLRPMPTMYADAALGEQLPPWEMFALCVAAFARNAPRQLHLSGWSAASMWGLPSRGSPPPYLEAIGPSCGGAGGWSTSVARVRRATLTDHYLGVRAEARVVSMGMAATTVALQAPLPTALMVAEAAVRRGADLTEPANHVAGWKGAARARWIAAHASPAAESPLESLGRFASIQAGLPALVPNAWVGPGYPKFRVDGLWPHHWVAIEADGAVKYNDRPDAHSIVMRQAEREWILRHECGLDLLRFGYPHTTDLQSLGARMAGLLARNPVRNVPMQWWKHVPGTGPVAPGPGDWPSPAPCRATLPQ